MESTTAQVVRCACATLRNTGTSEMHSSLITTPYLKLRDISETQIPLHPLYEATVAGCQYLPRVIEAARIILQTVKDNLPIPDESIALLQSVRMSSGCSGCTISSLMLEAATHALNQTADTESETVINNAV